MDFNKAEEGDDTFSLPLRNCRRLAKAPDTAGVAMEVPDIVPRARLVLSSHLGDALLPVELPSELADTTLSPIAQISGFVLPSAVGPREENLVTV